MDRALNLGLLGGALDDTANLPSPTELRTMLAEAEVAAFFAQPGSLTAELVETAWNLHHVGTVRPALQIYGVTRQTQANSVAAHIFDLLLRGGELTEGEQLVSTFAAQVSSIRGDRTPNATALGRRLMQPTATFALEPGRASLELGCAFLTFDRAKTSGLLRSLRSQQRTAGARTVDSELGNAGLASASGVVDGVSLLQSYMTNGDSADLDGARQVFERAATAPSSRRDLDSRWVAAHLYDLCDDFGRSSVWAILPPDTPPAVGRAMTLGNPPVMTLWPPQIEVLSDSLQSPLRHEVKRSVLTFPTSAGKTLLAQLIVAEHLATVGTGVCFVAPSHSLCREVREGLDRRLWVLRKHIAEDGPLGDPSAASAPVVVMTPERLAARLRSGEQELLDEFGLFVLDEAHLLDDETRGWTFETTISRLHVLTQATEHRLVLVSAALGGTATVRTWLDVEAAPATTSLAWRGPRRLHATYAPTENPETTVVVPPTGRQKLARERTELNGIVRLYVDDGAAVATRSAPLGHVVRAGKKPTKPTRAAQLAPIVHHAAKAGAVLTVHATKKSAERLAACIAEDREDKSETVPLVSLAELRLGSTHPLVPVLRRGVAYHHAALPADLQAEIENAVRRGAIDIVCATTTLTEGINLPVRTVIVCERGYYDGSDFHELIDAADLMNAAGRAGRAGRETDGWVVIAKEHGAQAPRVALKSIDVDQNVRSTLNVESALAELSEYELLLHETAGVVLAEVPSAVDGFLAYCWYLADAADELDAIARGDHVVDGIRQTLAWQQLPEEIQIRWEALGRRVAVTHDETAPEKRRRWARSGARLSANAVLEDVSQGAAAATSGMREEQAASPLDVLSVLLADGRLEKLLGLLPARDHRFKRKRYGATELAQVDLTALVLDWVRGVPLGDLVATHLSEVDAGDDDSFRFEQLSTFLTRVCEHHLPWTIGTILEWINSTRDEDLSPALPAHIHYGVADTLALELMGRQVRSRRLSVIVANAARDAGVGTTDLSLWLTELGSAEWREQFQAGPTEVADLLQFLHDPSTAIGGRLLEGESLRLRVDPGEPWGDDVERPIGYAVAEEQPHPLTVTSADGRVVATIRTAEHRDLAVLIDAGFQLTAEPARVIAELVTEVTIAAQLD